MSKPKLALIPSGYKSGKVYSILPNDASGDFDFTRQSIGTRVRKDGLIEEAKTVGSITNKVLYSEEFNNSYWSKQGGCTVTSDTTLAPNGTFTADTLSGATGTSVSGTVLRRNVVISGISTLSIYVKSLGSTNFTIYIRNGGNGQVFSQSITPDNDWQRVTLTTDPANGQVFFGNTNGDVAIWGAMLSEGALSDYIKTEGSSETKTVETFTDVPRLDWLNSNCPSLLLEPQRTNYITYTEQFNNSSWVKATSDSTPIPIVTENATISPTGEMTADRVQLTAPPNNSWAVVRKSNVNTGATSGSNLQQTIYLKANGISQVGKKVDIYIYDFSNSTYKTIENYTLTNDWQRVEVEHTITGNTSTNLEYSFGKARNNVGGSLQSETATDFFVWGAMLEKGSYTTSYIKTEASAVTRLKDECLNGGDSDLFDITEGTFFVDANNFGTPLDNSSIITLSDGGNNFVRFIYESSRIRATVYNGAIQSDYFITGVNDNERNKVAITFKENEFKTYLNGVLKDTDTIGVVPTNFNRLNFANNGGTARHFEGKVYDTRVYDRVLTEAEAIEITK